MGASREARGLSRRSLGEIDILSLRSLGETLILLSLGDIECSLAGGRIGIDGAWGRMIDGLRARASACETTCVSNGGGVISVRVDAVEPLLSEPAHPGT